ncbi:DsbA family oxidoreductase [Dictyobacter formicarum]|uniref:DSBA oxidoreductase n=1 Tax=Dictyobacter formicarum TaxID=2778368 RepID=A0ABQ3VC31_9CHLR|nr:DsbA family oxidoreductase [Dictyobacter formicarum]GHO83712.1 DSBA oxidoreductase [Dictyobacter formicarum]
MKVEIWSDVACPWCYIGKRRFEAALAEFKHKDQVEVIWRSYQLDPSAPRTSDTKMTDVLAQKYGVSVQQAAAMNERVSTLAAEVGLDYHMDDIRHSNTFDAHRLIHLAASHNVQDAAKERLLKAYFTEGASIGDTETLVKLASEVGIDAEEARSVLAGNAYTDDVKADIERARMFGIEGVPFFAVDEKYGISGAQPTEVFKQALDQAWAESHPLIKVKSADADSGYCEGDNCVIPQQ